MGESQQQARLYSRGCRGDRRLRTLNVNGQQVETVGIPLHWGFEGVARKGYIANTLTPNVGDSNSQTPEYKAFPVNIEKA